MKCQRVSALSGTGCDLQEGHDGEHVKTYAPEDYPQLEKPYSVRWSDEQDARAVDVESKRKQGT